MLCRARRHGSERAENETNRAPPGSAARRDSRPDHQHTRPAATDHRKICAPKMRGQQPFALEKRGASFRSSLPFMMPACFFRFDRFLSSQLGVHSLKPLFPPNTREITK